MKSRKVSIKGRMRAVTWKGEPWHVTDDPNNVTMRCGVRANTRFGSGLTVRRNERVRINCGGCLVAIDER